MQTIALFNQKGGTGKTTSAVNIAAGLVRLGRRVLLVDMDPQANATLSLGIAGELEKTTFEVLDGTITATDAIHDRGGLSVIPSGLQLAAAELRFAGVPGREMLLRDALEGIGADFDFILIDCPPSLGLLTLNALGAATAVYIPIQAEFLPIRGIAQLLDTVELVRRRINKGLAVRGVFGTFYDGRKTLNRDVIDHIKQTFGASVFNTYIRDNVALAEAPGRGQTIFEYEPGSHGAADYLELCKEIIERVDHGKENA